MLLIRFVFITFCLIFSFKSYADIRSYIGHDAILLGWLQENASYGRIEEVTPIGLSALNLYPLKHHHSTVRTPNQEGIVFPAKNATILRTKQGLGDVPRILRAGAATFSVNVPQNSSKVTHIYAFNRSKKIQMREGQNISLIYSGAKKELIATFNHIRQANGKLKKVIFRTKNNIYTDGTPNIFAWRRYNGLLQIFLNNKFYLLDQDISWSHRASFKEAKKLFHTIGHTNGDLLKIDSVIFIQKELSSAQWHNLLNWLYKRPFVTIVTKLKFHGHQKFKDNIERVYKHNITAFSNYSLYAEQEQKRNRRHMGSASLYNNKDFQTVMKDDFKSNRLSSSFRNNMHHSIWSAPNFNSAIEMAARSTEPNSTIDQKLKVYDYHNNTLRLGMKYDGHKHYYAGTISTVDQDGVGRYHGGTRRYYLKSRSPKKKYIADNKMGNELAQAYFPAFWGYAIDHLRNRAAPRVELDWFEWHGHNPYWGNVFINHVHEPVLNAGHLHSDDKPIKLLGTLLNEEKTGLIGGINRWDGNVQEHAITIDEDTGYVYIDYRDARTKAMSKDKTNHGWVELVRSKIQSYHLLPFYIIINHAMKPYGLKPHELDAYKNATSFEKKNYIANDYLELLSFKVSYKPKRLSEIPKGFKTRPYILGDIKENNIIKCVAETKNADILHYDWYKADGTPLALTNNDDYVIPKNFDGKGIYCKAYSHADNNLGYIEGYSKVLMERHSSH